MACTGVYKSFSRWRKARYGVYKPFSRWRKALYGVYKPFSRWREALYGVYKPFSRWREALYGVYKPFSRWREALYRVYKPFSRWREALYMVYMPFRVSVFQIISPAPPSRFRRESFPSGGFGVLFHHLLPILYIYPLRWFVGKPTALEVVEVIVFLCRFKRANRTRYLY